MIVSEGLQALTLSVDHSETEINSFYLCADRRRNESSIRYGRFLLISLMSQSNRAFMFTFREQDDVPGMTWCLRFPEGPFDEWKDKFTTYMWEGKNRMSYAKAKADEKRYIQEAYEDVEMPDAEAIEEDEAEDQEQDGSSSGEDTGSEGEESVDTESSNSEAFARGSKNGQLAVGYKNDLSYVTRGDMIGVFAHTDDKVRFRTTIDRVKDTKGKTFVPRKVGDMINAADDR
jgi:hypothetical protein